jgi:hypothetical protein
VGRIKWLLDLQSAVQQGPEWLGSVAIVLGIRMPSCMQDPQSLFTGLVESTGEKSAKVLREIAARSRDPPLSIQGHIPSHTDYTDYTIPEGSPLPSLSSLDVSHHAFDDGFRRSGGADRSNFRMPQTPWRRNVVYEPSSYACDTLPSPRLYHQR